MRLRELLPMARDSVADPRAGFARMRALDLDRGTLWQSLIALVALSVVLAEASIQLLRAQGVEPALPILAQPFTTAAVQLVMLVVLVVLIHTAGRLLGGTGSFEDALLAVVWLQFVMACLQVVQAVFLIVLPFVAGLIGVAGIVLFFWLLAGFVAELHGFGSRWRVLAGIVIGLLGLSMGLALLLAMFGIGISGVADV